MYQNHFQVIGNLGKDSESNTTATGKVVVKNVVAVNENYKDKSGEWQTKATWVNIVAWENKGLQLSTLDKGQAVLCIGSYSSRSYEDKSGVKKWISEMNVKEIYKIGYIKVEDKLEAQSSADELPDDDDLPDDDLPF